MSLGYAPMKDRATQMGIEHITEIINKPTDRGYIAYAHTTSVANKYRHWPVEAYEATQAKLPTLRVLSYLMNISGVELEHIQNVQSPNNIATTIRAAFNAVDQDIAAQRQHIPYNQQPKDYAKHLRNQCQPLKYAERPLKHLVSIWEEGVND